MNYRIQHIALLGILPAMLLLAGCSGNNTETTTTTSVSEVVATTQLIQAGTPTEAIASIVQDQPNTDGVTLEGLEINTLFTTDFTFNNETVYNSSEYQILMNFDTSNLSQYIEVSQLQGDTILDVRYVNGVGYASGTFLETGGWDVSPPGVMPPELVVYASLIENQSYDFEAFLIPELDNFRGLGEHPDSTMTVTKETLSNGSVRYLLDVYDGELANTIAVHIYVDANGLIRSVEAPPQVVVSQNDNTAGLQLDLELNVQYLWRNDVEIATPDIIRQTQP